MTEAARYRIIDEPAGGALARLAVNPIWPMFAIMFAGSWLSWPWFVLNAWAVGSPTRRRELALACGGFAGNALFIITIGALARHGVIPESSVKYGVLALIVWKLGVSYFLFNLQTRTFELFEHYGGTVRSGVVPIFVGVFLVDRLIQAIPDSFLRLVIR
jgi:hypothetical protein